MSSMEKEYTGGRSSSSSSHKDDNDNENMIWKVIDAYFQDNPQALVNHHVESYNDFFQHDIFQIFREKNPLKFMHNSKYDSSLNDYTSKCTMYMGGKDGSKIYFGKPILYDQNEPHFMFPNEARLRNITYAMTIHYDIEIEFLNILPVNSIEEATSGDFTQQKRGGGNNNEEDNDSDEEDSEDDKPTYHEKNRFKGGAPVNDDESKSKKKKKKKTIAATGISPSDAKSIREYITDTIEKDPNTHRIVQKRVMKLERIYLGKFPIMVQSNMCILNGTTKETRYGMGECRNDRGGYFIIDGKEKVVVPQEKFADNMLYIRQGIAEKTKYLYSAEIRSVSENVSKPIRTLSIHLLAPGKQYTFGNIVVNIPNVRKPVPLFIVFRALGIVSDRDILSMIWLDIEKYESMLDVFVPSIHDAGLIYTQRNAIQYIGYLTKGKKYYHGLEILADYFLPHVGETNYREKAFYLGYMVFRMMSVQAGWELPTDRDHFKYKRLELVGGLIHSLFREYYTLQLKSIHLKFESQLNLKDSAGTYIDNLPQLIQDHYQEIFREEGRIVEKGFKKAFKGSWGASAHTKRVGVIQGMDRLSYNTMVSHLRKINLPMDSGLKIVGPRLLHNSQWGFIDPLDTPDGGNIGFHKNLAITTTVSRGHSREAMVEWLREMVGMRMVTDHVPFELASASKIMVNGYWAGCILDPLPALQKILTYRRNAMLPIHTSATFDYRFNTLFIYTDAGRLCRPIFYSDEGGTLSLFRKEIQSKFKENRISWNGMTRGFQSKRKEQTEEGVYTHLHEVYESVGETIEQDPGKLIPFLKQQAIVDYIDSSESEHAYIALNVDAFHDARSKDSSSGGKYTHCEIHESLMFGVMGNQITFPEMNPYPRDLFSCGQSKQACSVYHSNYQMRMDKTATVLQYGQIPLVKTRFSEYIHREEHPYGFNAIVAIACYSGYNVEDAILINAGALARGMFRTTYYTSYSSHEERGDSDGTSGEAPIDQLFTNIEDVADTVTGLKSGYDYSHLDSAGLVREGTPMNDKIILMGMTATTNVGGKVIRGDMSVKSKKGQVGYVDKTYMTEGDEGERIAKIRIREERIPAMGDKFAGRAGQKGTIGMVIPECDMPFTKEGIRPDIIINPHAIPSRMTIGQLVESVTGKACTIYGGFADCTAFGQKGSKVDNFGRMLQSKNERDHDNENCYESYGNEILYDGMTGEQMESSIFLGTVYYMRLKHMVKDKQQSRTQGPRNDLTKQPVEGRANDGGLRVGEMERDSIMGHGATGFLTESMMERSDKYHVAICNQSGMLAIYNPTKNLFMSPMTDGPLKFMGDQLRDSSQLRLETVTRFGRNFSIVEIPYTLKLLIQELQTINVQLRIITEDNIDQLEALSYSRIQQPDEYGKKLEELVKMSSEGLNQDLRKKVQDAMRTTLVSDSPYYDSPENEFKIGDKVFISYNPESELPADFRGEWDVINIDTNDADMMIISRFDDELNKQIEQKINKIELIPKPSFEIGENVYYNKDALHQPWNITDMYAENLDVCISIKQNNDTIVCAKENELSKMESSSPMFENDKWKIINEAEYESPLFSPTSPTFPPPPRPENESPLFSPTSPTLPPQHHVHKGQSVHLQGDNKPERIWRVDMFVKDQILIKTTDMEGLPENKSLIRVSEDRLIPILLKKRQFVHLLGDTKPDRIWMIDDVETTENTVFVTLMTNDTDGLSEKDQIQVVKDNRIAPILPIQHGGGYGEKEVDGFGSGGGGGGNGIRIPFGNGMGAGGGDGNFIFSPVLINGGNLNSGMDSNSMDMLQQQQQPQQPSPMMMGHSMNNERLPPLSLNDMGGHHGHNNGRKSAGFEGEGSSSSSKEKSSNGGGGGGEKSWFGKAVDFTTNLIVKKL